MGTAAGLKVVHRKRSPDRTVLVVNSKGHGSHDDDRREENHESQDSHHFFPVPDKNLPSEPEPGSIEHCVITTGWPRLPVSNLITLLVVLSPVLVTVLILFAYRFYIGLLESGCNEQTAQTTQQAVFSHLSEHAAEQAIDLMITMFFVCKLNLGIVMSSSHLITGRHAHNVDSTDQDVLGGYLSGIFIGAEPL